METTTTGSDVRVLPSKTGWLYDLKEPTRSRVLEEMRGLWGKAQEASDRHYKLQAPRCTLAVGSADFDDFLKSEVLFKFLRGLNDGDFPSIAAHKAREYGKLCVRVHNSRRPKDRSWQRWEQSGDQWVENAERLIYQHIHQEIRDARGDRP
jgi:hypothetical protein